MSTPTTTGMPPVSPTPPTPPTPGGPAPAPFGNARLIATLAIVFGSLIVIGTLFSGVTGTIAAASEHTSSRTIDVTGVGALSAELNAGSLRVEFADVPEAELTVTAGADADQWTLNRDGGTLEVRSPNGMFRGWGPWLRNGRGNGNAVLTLPRTLSGMDAALDLSAGKLTATGDFGELSVTAGAGRVDVQGSAHSVKTEMNAGRADLALSDVDTADLRVNAGELNATLTGAQPTHLELSASAGAMDVTVPAGSYQVTADTSAGSFENRVGSAPGASSTVQVNVSAGRILLQSGN